MTDNRNSYEIEEGEVPPPEKTFKKKAKNAPKSKKRGDSSSETSSESGSPDPEPNPHLNNPYNSSTFHPNPHFRFQKPRFPNMVRKFIHKFPYSGPGHFPTGNPEEFEPRNGAFMENQQKMPNNFAFFKPKQFPNNLRVPMNRFSNPNMNFRRNPRNFTEFNKIQPMYRHPPQLNNPYMPPPNIVPMNNTMNEGGFNKNIMINEVNRPFIPETNPQFDNRTIQTIQIPQKIEKNEEIITKIKESLGKKEEEKTVEAQKILSKLTDISFDQKEELLKKIRALQQNSQHENKDAIQKLISFISNKAGIEKNLEKNLEKGLEKKEKDPLEEKKQKLNEKMQTMGIFIGKTEEKIDKSQDNGDIKNLVNKYKDPRLREKAKD